MKKFITTFAAVVIAASVTASAAAATAFHSNYSGTQDIKKGTETVYSIDASYKPEVATGNAKVATTKFWYQSGNRYFYKLNATGNVGASTGVYAGTKASKSQIFVAKVTSPTHAAVPTSIKCSHSGTIDLNHTSAYPEVNDNLNRTISGYSGGAFYFTVDAPAGTVVSLGNSAVGTLGHPYANVYSYAGNNPDGASTGVYANGVQLFVIKNYSTPSAYNKSQDEFADELLTLINNERSKHEDGVYVDGVVVPRGTTAPLTKVDYLMKAAAVRAQEMSISYSHVRPSGTTVELVNSFSDHKVYAVSEVGYGPASTSSTATSAFTAWMNSDGHRVAMMTPEYVNYGAAYYTTPGGSRYFVALFSMS